MSVKDENEVEEVEEIEENPYGRTEEEVEEEEEVESDDEDLDETFGERIWGLTEMFPCWLRNGVASVSTGSVSGAKSLYAMSRSAFWIVFSSSVILVAPVLFEVERAQMDELQKQQQRQILLGPNAAVTGQSHFPVPMPPPSR